MGYLAPNYPISDDWRGHKNRPTPSREPGTDYATPYGTPLAAPGAGVVASVDPSNGGAEGRAIRIHFDDGRAFRMIHLDSDIRVAAGERVWRGRIIAFSGASANGSDWGVGSHVHYTLLPTWNSLYANSIDFELYADPNPGTAGEDSRPFEPNPSEEDDMYGQTDRERDDNIYAALWQGGSVQASDGAIYQFNYGVLPIVAHNQTLIGRLSGEVAALKELIAQVADGVEVELDYQKIADAAEAGTREALEDLPKA